MTATPAAPCPPTEPPPEQRPPLKRLGLPGRPVRVLAFAGGGFDTAMQLGVTHALMVSRGSPPDMVIGCSAGAINAVALAEVFQAGDETARVARYRRIFEGYMNAPGKIAHATRPDAFQVDTERPLAPIELPIHQQPERRHRLEALQSRAGLINLYNMLLSLDVTVGTATRAVRRLLGVNAAGAIPVWWRRWMVRAIEGFRLWMLVGENLLRTASVARVVILALLRPRQRAERGATAGDLIFRPAWMSRLRIGAANALTALLLVSLWVFVGALALGAVYGVSLKIARALWKSAPPWLMSVEGWAAVIASGLLVGLAGLVALPRGTGWLRRFRRALSPLVGFVFLVALRGAILMAASAVLAPAFHAAFAPRGERRWAWPWDVASAYWLLGGAAIMLVALVVLGLAFRRRKRLGRALLARHGMAHSVLAAHPVREVLVDLFDPDYYGRRDIESVVEEALETEPTVGDVRSGEPEEKPAEPRRKLLEHYAAADRDPAIHVGLTVANVANGQFYVLPGTWPVVDGLMAAVAAPPLLPSPPSPEGVLVDGTVVANEPTRPLFSYLRQARLPDGRQLVEEDATELHVYSVAALPFTESRLGPERLGKDGRPLPYTDLVDIVARALQLRRFRDATLERRLTELNTKAMETPGTIFYDPPDPACLTEDLHAACARKRLLRTHVFAIEPQYPLNLNRRLLLAETEGERRRLLGEAVADGCRATLEVMIRPTIHEARRAGGDLKAPDVLCARAVAPLRDGNPLPGSAVGEEHGPGLVEVCRHCALRRPAPDGRIRLRVPTDEPGPPPWPVPRGPVARRSSGFTTSPVAPEKIRELHERWAGRWPEGPKDTAPSRPTVSLLFSGGVFRGVFQMGVLNALSELYIKPDVIAGASVGSITAAMVARTFIAPKLAGVDEQSAEALTLRRRQALVLAATYLGIDRLILTDRFADFIRTFTVRAAGARISIRDVDRVLRRFDEPDPWTFSREMRAVLAGLERLTYVSPYELNDLVEAFRRQKHARTVRLLLRHFQEWLGRMGVANEVLGAEPLARLIREHVLAGLVEGPPDDAPLGAFLRYGLCFLATATNLTDGKLEILGEAQLEDQGRKTRLLEALLASSAFPGVFRPRWAWEVHPGIERPEQYIDGGVMDNLPVDAVAQFLHRAARHGIIQPRPAEPHLVVCASLEPQQGELRDAAALERVRAYWPGLRRRAQKLGYNQKLDVFRRTQQNLRAVFAHRTALDRMPEPGEPASTILSLDVVPIIPNWLPETFAFHPMLGFRRRAQAESIAHGCASTLLRFAELVNRRPGTAAAWGVRLDPGEAAAAARSADTFAPIGGAEQGHCRFRPGTLCPFSVQGQAVADGRRPAAMIAALAEIYRACGQPSTHGPRKGESA